MEIAKPEGESSVAEPLSHTQRRLLIDRCLTEVSLFAKELCPAAIIEATLERYEDEDGHVLIYPPADVTERDIEEIERKVADRGVDILVETGLFLCTAGYEPEP